MNMNDAQARKALEQTAAAYESAAKIIRDALAREAHPAFFVEDAPPPRRGLHKPDEDAPITGREDW